jgi:fatty aldehyde-generating acyl-ACP reductase
MTILKHFLGLMEDLFLHFLPINKKGVYKFAFIVHPRSRQDIQRKFPFFKFFPNTLTDMFTKYFPPITVSKVTGLKSLKNAMNIEGYIIAVLPTAHQLMENRELALKRIKQACTLAQNKGAKIIGLGGLTSSLSKGGLDLLSKVGVGITTGHAYTSHNVTQNVISLCEYMELDKHKIKIGVVGAAGSIGSTVAKLLITNDFNNLLIIDVERKRSGCDELEVELRKIKPEISIDISHQIGDIKDCDIIVAATNAPEALIQAKDLKWGAIVIDDAQPSDVHYDVFDRQDVLVVEAGVTYTPNINNNFNFGLKNKNDNFCCLAEVLILAANHWDKHYVINRASLELVDEISKFGNQLHFEIGDYQNFHELISPQKLAFVKNCIKQNEL